MSELKKKFRAGSKEASFLTVYENSLKKATKNVVINKARFLDNI